RDKLAAVLRKVTVGGGTALYDALDDSLRKVKKGQHDKKAVLLITDGVDTASYTKLEEAQLSVREAELLVYCIGIAPANMGTMTERNPTPPNNGGGYPGGGRRGGGGYPGGGYPGGVGIPIPGIPGGIPFPIPGRRPFPLQQRRNGGPMNPDSVDMD